MLGTIMHEVTHVYISNQEGAEVGTVCFLGHPEGRNFLNSQAWITSNREPVKNEEDIAFMIGMFTFDISLILFTLNYVQDKKQIF
jgi:hypothetical protein